MVLVCSGVRSDDQVKGCHAGAHLSELIVKCHFSM